MPRVRQIKVKGRKVNVGVTGVRGSKSTGFSAMGKPRRGHPAKRYTLRNGMWGR